MKENIVMIHGMWGNSESWDCFKPFFESVGYSCKTPVLRFHEMNPQSEPDPALGRMSLLDYVQDLEKGIAILPSKPIIMGHSMGGLLTQMLASRGLAKAIVLLAPAPPAGIVFYDSSVARCFKSTLTTPGFWHKPVRWNFEEASYGIFHMLPESERKETYKKYVFESGHATFEIVFWYLDFKKASKVDEKLVTCPTLIVSATEDRLTPAKMVSRVAKKYGAVSTYKEFSNHSHRIIKEPGWEEVATYVWEWLKNIPAGA
jgi:pimeloyl-ACP methyl ester carboxylesterase